MQVPPGVSQEGDGVSRPHADCHGGEPGGRAVQYGLRLHGHLAGHGAGCVVGAAGVRVQSVLVAGEQVTSQTTREMQTAAACFVQKKEAIQAFVVHSVGLEALYQK